MAGGIDWFRWHHGSTNDPKFRLVAKRACARLGDVLAMWAMVLEQSSASEDRGNPGNLDFEAIDLALDMDDGAAEAIYTAMTARDLIDAETGRVLSWEKRQPKRERPDDNSTERSREHRAKKRSATPDGGDATPSNATQHQETPREEKSREEKSTSSLRSEVGRASRLPPDWVLPDDWADWARTERPDLDPTSTASSFRDYWVAKPGKDGRKADWLATWRNWVRNQRSTAAPRGTGPPQSRQSALEARNAAVAARVLESLNVTP